LVHGNANDNLNFRVYLDVKRWRIMCSRPGENMIDKFEFCDGIIDIICGTMIKTEKPTTQTQNPLKFQILNLERKNFC
jgi:hypothetical protein